MCDVSGALSPLLYSVKVKNVPKEIVTSRRGMAGLLLCFVMSRTHRDACSVTLTARMLARYGIEPAILIKYLSRIMHSSGDTITDRLVLSVRLSGKAAVVVVFNQKEISYARTMRQWSGFYRDVIHYQLTSC